MKKVQPVLLEVCCGSLEAALLANSANAHRIELCKELLIGGTTPTEEDIRQARQLKGMKLHVLVRSRGGDFVYSEDELKMMEDSIRFCGEIGCDGVVVGVLTSDNKVNKQDTARLVKLAQSYSLSVTYHRAFDETDDLFQALEDCIDLGCDRILTSGGKSSAVEGLEVLAKLIEQAGDRIIIMPGAGVSPDNILEITTSTHCKEIHGSFQASAEKIQEAIILLNKKI
jgi:Uncharacterized protein involved in copper resistance